MPGSLIPGTELHICNHKQYVPIGRSFFIRGPIPYNMQDKYTGPPPRGFRVDFLGRHGQIAKWRGMPLYMETYLDETFPKLHPFRCAWVCPPCCRENLCSEIRPAQRLFDVFLLSRIFSLWYYTCWYRRNCAEITVSSFIEGSEL